MKRCDLHGPYTPEQAAAIVLGARPTRTGYLCPQCQNGVAQAAQALADAIDRQAVEQALAAYSDHAG